MRALLSVLLLLFCHCGTDGFFEVISPAAPGAGNAGCPNSTRGPVSSLEIGERAFLDDGTEMFVLLDDGSPATIVQGTQGADMLVLAFRVTGAGSQTCIAQRTDITDAAGERISYNAVARNFEPQPDDSSISEWIFFPGPYVPGPLTIEATLGGQTLVRHVEAGR